MIMVRFKGDMTWMVDLPAGSRPGKHEIMVPEGEVIYSPYHSLVFKFQQKSTGLFLGQFPQTKVSIDYRVWLIDFR